MSGAKRSQEALRVRTLLQRFLHLPSASQHRHLAASARSIGSSTAGRCPNAGWFGKIEAILAGKSSCNVSISKPGSFSYIDARKTSIFRKLDVGRAGQAAVSEAIRKHSALLRCVGSMRVSTWHLFGQSSRKMCTTSNLLNSSKMGLSDSGLKLLVTKGPHAQKAVGIWLFGCAAWVFCLVVLGGVTRLTRSGLSMTDWKFTGTLPPFSQDEWLAEFQKYKQSPEYMRVNKGMSVEDFKFIYWMEYAHRMWGRGLGVVFALPFTYFLAKGFITRQLGLRLSALFALGAGQGLVGWWMVKSGLQEPASEYVQPRVSPYRLATHLTSAFVIYCGILWTALSVVMPEPPNGTLEWARGAAKIRKLALPISALIGITTISGAFVAGNDAGHAYNTFPKMGDTWIPEGILEMDPLIQNFFENTPTVQFNHRVLATTSLISVGGLWLAARKLDMHPTVRSLIGSTLGMSTLQVTLGITTLLTYVPVSLASAHQAGAMSLFTLLLILVHCVRKPSPAMLKSLASVPKR